MSEYLGKLNEPCASNRWPNRVGDVKKSNILFYYFIIIVYIIIIIIIIIIKIYIY